MFTELYWFWSIKPQRSLAVMHPSIYSTHDF